MPSKFFNFSIPNKIAFFEGIFDFGIGLSSDELREQTKFEKILKRMMGICSDPTKSIDVAGTAKLNDLDFIDDSFFEVSNQELRNIEQTVLNIQNGSVVFTDCGDVELPMNIQLVTATLDEIIKENKDSKKIDLLLSSFSNIANDPKWKTLVPKLGLDINLNLAIQGDFLLKLPRAVFKTILSPKVMLGFMIMVKSIRNAFTLQLDLDFDNLNDFRKFAFGQHFQFWLFFLRKMQSFVGSSLEHFQAYLFWTC